MFLLIPAVPSISQRDLVMTEALLPVLPGIFSELASANPNRPDTGAVMVL
jgi:hypothetical protein